MPLYSEILIEPRVVDTADLVHAPGDAPIKCCAVSTDGRAFMAGDEAGAVHILRLDSLSR